MIRLLVGGELVVIAVFSAAIAIEFYKSKDGVLRILIIQLFVSKLWLYGGISIYYAWLYGKVDTDMYLITVLTPMFVTMVQLFLYIRNKNNS